MLKLVEQAYTWYSGGPWMVATGLLAGWVVAQTIACISLEKSRKRRVRRSRPKREYHSE